MLEAMYIAGFLGMIIMPIIAGIVIGRKFKLSWRLFAAGGLTFIASQVLHVPLVMALNPSFASWGLVISAIVLGLLAGLFEETARYILFKFVLKKARTWEEGVFVGLGHGGTEAILLGILAAIAFGTMLTYRSLDLSTVPGIPPEQLDLAKQQVAAYWSEPAYVPLLGFLERVFAICLHLSLSVMVLYGLLVKKPIWFWLAVLWHTLIDALAVYLVANISILALEGMVAVFAIISLGIVFWLRSRFTDAVGPQGQSQPVETGTG